MVLVSDAMSNIVEGVSEVSDIVARVSEHSVSLLSWTPEITERVSTSETALSVSEYFPCKCIGRGCDDSGGTLGTFMMDWMYLWMAEIADLN